jgi:phosphatidylethanolamine-binding protein (PEBP) family uncharacterized protein
LASLLFLIGLGLSPRPGFGQAYAEKDIRMELTSSAFKQGKMIPDPHTCKGENISPELS